MPKLRLIPYAVLTAGGLIAACGAANAQSMYEINRIQDYQQNRIEQGVRSGQITRGEEYRLEQGERAIDRAQRRAEADGHVSGAERARIDRMVQQQNREIYRDSHNNRQAWDRGQQWGRTDGNAHNGWRDRDGWGRAGYGNNWGHNGDNRGWDRREAFNHDRRDFGRDHNDGSWNNGRDHNGWNRNPGTGGTGGTGGTNTGWNHNGGWNHNPGTGGTGGTGTTGTGNTGSGWNHNGGWNRGGSTGGSAVASNTGTRSWGGQTRPANYTTNTSTRTYSNGGYTGGRSGHR